MNTRELLLIAFILVMLFVPYPSLVCPEWTVRVVNENGEPLQGRFVDQQCQDYTLGIDPCMVPDSRQHSDRDGIVRFPMRVIWAGMLSRILRSAYSIATWPGHRSWGAYVYVWTSGPNNPEIRYNPWLPLPDTLVVSEHR